MNAISVAAAPGPIPGTERSRSAFWHHAGEARMNESMSLSATVSCCLSHLIWSFRLSFAAA